MTDDGTYIEWRGAPRSDCLSEMRRLLAQPNETLAHPARAEGERGKGYRFAVTQSGPEDRMTVVLPALLQLQYERLVHDSWLRAANGEAGEVLRVDRDTARPFRRVPARRQAGFGEWLRLAVESKRRLRARPIPARIRAAR